MAVITSVETGRVIAGECLIPPIATIEAWPAFDPQSIASFHNTGIHLGEGIQNQIGLYNGLGNWCQLGFGNLIGFGADVGGHCDAQPTLESSASQISFNSGNGSLNGFWTYKGVEITNEATDSTSDIRLKKDIEPYTNCLDKILNLNPVYYKWRDGVEKFSFIRRDGDGAQIGLIAQDVEKIIPEVVSNHKIYDEEYKRIKYSKLTAVLIGAIQEQQDQINSLKETVQELSTKLAQCCP